MDILYNIALSKLKGVGNVNALILLNELGDSRSIFVDKHTEHLNKLLTHKNKSEALDLAKQEMEFISKENITPLFIGGKHYPTRLKDCKGAPILLYQKGSTDLNKIHCLSIVGTRKPTLEGIKTTERLVEEIAEHFPQTLIVSGLAYGIDIAAHKSALKNQLPTIAVLGHGLHKIYPAAHKNTAQKILQKQGSLITEYTSNSTTLPKNFIQRNSIVAGISDATIVVESKISGGAMSTAHIANSYGRDVLAIPGNIDRENAKGCNHLIKTNIAALIENVKDIGYALGWNINKTKQQQLFFDLLPEEQAIIDKLQQQGKMNIDVLSQEIKTPTNKLLATLTQLEFKAIVLAHPGKFYSLNK